MLGNPVEVQAATFDSSGMLKMNASEFLDGVVSRKMMQYGIEHEIYELVDDDGVVRYVGRTKQGVKKRFAQHKAQDPNGKGLLTPRTATYKVEGGEKILLKNLSYSEARGLEHMVYDRALKNLPEGKTLFNKIRPLNIDSLNKVTMAKVRKCLDAAGDFLKKVL